MKRIYDYMCRSIPEDDEIREALELSNSQDCYIQLHYTVWGYPYMVRITPEDTFEIVKDRMPKCYGAWLHMKYEDMNIINAFITVLDILADKYAVLRLPLKDIKSELMNYYSNL